MTTLKLPEPKIPNVRIPAGIFAPVTRPRKPTARPPTNVRCLEEDIARLDHILEREIPDHVPFNSEAYATGLEFIPAKLRRI